MDDAVLSAKKRDKKIDITDVAIKKIPRIKYKGLSEEENDVMQQLAELVLVTAKTRNNSNEVAITCALGADNPLEDIGISYGDEHEVNICADTTSFHMIMSGQKCVVVLHNHPSTQTLSLEDIVFFLHYSTIHTIVVVTNQGNIHYMSRDDDYDYENARRLYNECISGLDKDSSQKEVYDAGLIFLARCSEAGLYYR